MVLSIYTYVYVDISIYRYTYLLSIQYIYTYTNTYTFIYIHRETYSIYGKRFEHHLISLPKQSISAATVARPEADLGSARVCEGSDKGKT